MTWLVTGGAGYIGGHVVKALRADGFDIVVLDDLSTGNVARVPAGVDLVDGSILEHEALRKVFDSYAITGVVHLAAKKRVDESAGHPLFYYRENVEGLRALLDACTTARVEHFLFSSSAAVYGEPKELPITEDSPCVPISPYGETKLAGEWLAHAVGAANDINTMALRYFNVAGVGDRPELAEPHGMNLVPMLLRAISAGDPPAIFGDAYPTWDGTCVRDYVHVVDVAEAHLAAVQSLIVGKSDYATLNIGTGTGVSVREMVDAALRVTGSSLEPVVLPRRPGDPPAVVAAVDRAMDVLGWRARLGINEMVESAWQAS